MNNENKTISALEELKRQLDSESVAALIRKIPVIEEEDFVLRSDNDLVVRTIGVERFFEVGSIEKVSTEIAVKHNKSVSSIVFSVAKNTRDIMETLIKEYNVTENEVMCYINNNNWRSKSFELIKINKQMCIFIQSTHEDIGFFRSLCGNNEKNNEENNDKQNVLFQ